MAKVTITLSDDGQGGVTWKAVVKPSKSGIGSSPAMAMAVRMLKEEGIPEKALKFYAHRNGREEVAGG